MSGPAIPFPGVIQLKQFGNCTVCHSLAANPFISWLRAHGSKQKQQPGQSEQGPGAGALCFPPQLARGFLACVALFSACKVGVPGVWVFGKPWEFLENTVRAALALGQRGGNPLAEDPQPLLAAAKTQKSKLRLLDRVRMLLPAH